MGKIEAHKTTSIKDGPDANKASDSDQLGVHLAQTAWRVAVPFLLFTIGGIMLDRKLGTEPLYSMLGLAAALLSVSVIVYKYVDRHYPGTFGGSDK